MDDAHGFGTLGEHGKGAGNEQGVQDQIDVYFATFAKSMASTGAFVAADKGIIDYLKVQYAFSNVCQSPCKCNWSKVR